MTRDLRLAAIGQVVGLAFVMFALGWLLGAAHG